jgi:MSHA biogenesis protein MshP
MTKKQKQQGFILPMAIFLIVIVTILGLALLKMNQFNNQESNFSILQNKAYFAAKTGLDYGLYQALDNGSCSNTGNTINIPGNYFLGFKATYSCQSITQNEAGTTHTYYQVTSVGCNTSNNQCPDANGKPTNDDYVQRSLTSMATN